MLTDHILFFPVIVLLSMILIVLSARLLFRVFIFFFIIFAIWYLLYAVNLVPSPVEVYQEFTHPPVEKPKIAVAM